MDPVRRRRDRAPSVPLKIGATAAAMIVTLAARAPLLAAGRAPRATSAALQRQWGGAFVPAAPAMRSIRLFSAAPADGSIVSGADYVRSAVIEALSSQYDYREVAAASALASLDKKGKKKKKKKKNGEGADGAGAAEDPPPPALTEEERAKIASAARDAALPFSARNAAVTAATQAEFGDYQCNAALSLAPALGLKPRDVAIKVAEALAVSTAGVLDTPEIAGPGFVNLRFSKEHLARSVRAMAADANGRMAVPKSPRPARIVVDYSSPNIAKEMHVGHLRSTIIGDTLSNLLEFAGHDVLRLNHVGDWGTQFGMLVEHLRDVAPGTLKGEKVDLGDLVKLYKAAKKRFDDDADFKDRAREGVVALQAGEEESLSAWKILCGASRGEYQKIYDTLRIKKLNERGESFYNPFLPEIVSDLESSGLAVESEGASVVFLDGFGGRDGKPLPLLVRKSDGGYNYATTDLAAVRQRTFAPDGEKASRVLYVTDSGQAQHFKMVFAAARLAGFCPEDASLEHVPFGLVQGEDGKKFATRSGDTVKLADLLDEAVRIAAADSLSRVDDPDAAPVPGADRVARAVGIGAVKYADLSMNRESNYRFSYGRMLSLNGNTAPYMLYAYARLCGIVLKATGRTEVPEGGMEWPQPADVFLEHEAEVTLARTLVRLPDILAEVESELYPNRLCDYLFETSQKFNQFYENCSVNNAETPELKASRLTLCTVTAGTLRLLLEILGIEVLDRF
eukprot:CAMPEP_0194281626 /NCGR_PEP_ID=MMETSP0169-20130528/21140_1 /TAXON_ID=218684 /ORGANISM="Corethron pennatum, Strain L29A3" /LENGTH=736 /DNA_ID=CAMNT_0039026735 /DNA_START=125 /DNA_END=2335 /DNA_ORIENTATION=-